MPPLQVPGSVWQQLLVPNRCEAIQTVQGGLSGAVVVKCKAPEGLACLRGWHPDHPNQARLQLIHAGLQQLTEAGLPFTPKVLRTPDNATFISDGNRFWELTTWLPGSANYVQHPSKQKLIAAVEALADIHQVWAAHSNHIVSQTILDRAERLQGWKARNSDLHRQAAAGCSSPDEEALVLRTCQALALQAPMLFEAILPLTEQPTCVHLVLRDIWSDHVLFATDHESGGERVSGMIDYGGVRHDEPTTDLVRLLSSLEPQRPDLIELGLAVYEHRRSPNVRVDRERFKLLDQASRLLSAAQWMEWLILERLDFHQPRSQLIARWRGFVDNLALS